jgi:hypothetical protein
MSLDRRVPVVSLETPDGEVTLSDALEMIHEDDVDCGTAQGAEHGYRAGRDFVRDDEAEPRGDFGDEAGDDRCRGAGDAALQQKGGRFVGEPREKARAA